MGSLQWKLEQLFCPSIDSTLIAAIVSDHPDFDSCFAILSSLVEAAEVERDIENEISSGNSSSNLRNSSSGEPGDGSTTSIEYSTYSPSVDDELDYSNAYTTDYEDYEYPKGNTEFLKNMFPMIPESRVNNLLREKDNNVEMVVDVILNEMYLQTEQEDDFSYSRSTSTLISNSDADNSLITDVRNKYRKKKRRKQNIIFQNNGHRPNSNNSSSSLSSSSSSSTSYWTSSSRNPESRNELIDDNKLCQLMDIFPNHNFESIKQTLVNCNGEVENATEILSSGALNDSKRQIKVIKLISHTSEHQDTHLQNKGRRTNDSNSYEMPINKIYDDDEIVDYEDDHDPDHCHEEVIRCFKKRDESFKKAAQSYRRGQGSVASYHSEEGWRLDAEMKKWKLRAARSLVKKHSEKTQYEYVLDLHGCFVTEAIMIVKEWLNDWYPKRMRSASPMKPLKIITGKGNHSPNGVAKLPNAINKFLIGDNWNITKHMGHVLVHGLKQ